MLEALLSSSSFNPGMNHAIPIFPIFLILAGLISVGWLVYSKTKKTTGISLGVIGMISSGKTTFLSKLGLVDYSEGTSEEDYEARNISIGVRKMQIASGKDIGGGEAWLKKYYADWMSQKDIIVFIFDGNEYLTDTEYQRATKRRLYHIYNNYKKRPEIEDFSNVVIIASHSDQYTNGPKKMYKRILESVQDRKYSNLFNNNFFVANLTDSKEVEVITKKVF